MKFKTLEKLPIILEESIEKEKEKITLVFFRYRRECEPIGHILITVKRIYTIYLNEESKTGRCQHVTSWI